MLDIVQLHHSCIAGDWPSHQRRRTLSTNQKRILSSTVDGLMWLRQSKWKNFRKSSFPKSSISLAKAPICAKHLFWSEFAITTCRRDAKTIQGQTVHKTATEEISVVSRPLFFHYVLFCDCGVVKNEKRTTGCNTIVWSIWAEAGHKLLKQSCGSVNASRRAQLHQFAGHLALCKPGVCRSALRTRNLEVCTEPTRW